MCAHAVTQACPTLQPHPLSPTRLLSMGFSRQAHWSGVPWPPLSMGFSRQAHWSGVPRPPLSMGFSRQAHWSGVPRPPQGDLPDPGIEPGSPTLQADSLPSELQGSPLPMSHLGSPSDNLKKSREWGRKAQPSGQLSSSQGPIIKK